MLPTGLPEQPRLNTVATVNTGKATELPGEEVHTGALMLENKTFHVKLSKYVFYNPVIKVRSVVH